MDKPEAEIYAAIVNWNGKSVSDLQRLIDRLVLIGVEVKKSLLPKLPDVSGVNLENVWAIDETGLALISRDSVSLPDVVVPIDQLR